MRCVVGLGIARSLRLTVRDKTAAVCTIVCAQVCSAAVAPLAIPACQNGLVNFPRAGGRGSVARTPRPVVLSLGGREEYRALADY